MSPLGTMLGVYQIERGIQMNTILTTSVYYEFCANAEDDRHEDYCERVIPQADYNAKRKALIGDLAWDLGGQRPECDSCEDVYNDRYSA